MVGHACLACVRSWFNPSTGSKKKMSEAGREEGEGRRGGVGRERDPVSK